MDIATNGFVTDGYCDMSIDNICTLLVRLLNIAFVTLLGFQAVLLLADVRTVWQHNSRGVPCQSMRTCTRGEFSSGVFGSG